MVGARVCKSSIKKEYDKKEEMVQMVNVYVLREK